MELFLTGVFLWALFFVLLYFVVKAAVRNGILESREKNEGEEDRYTDGDVSKKTCPTCGCRHDMDYPKCPACKHSYV